MSWLKKLFRLPKVRFIPQPSSFIVKMLRGHYPSIYIDGPDDSKYHIQFSEVVFEWLQGFEKLRKYVEDVFDCDDYSDWLKAWFAIEYKLNTVGRVKGDSPWGWHAYNIVVCVDGVYIIEPQVKYMWPVKEAEKLGFKPQRIYI